MIGFLRPIELLAGKALGEAADINRWDLDVGYALVPVGRKNAVRYAQYIRGEFEKGVPIVHLLACGHSRIAKTHRLIEALIDGGVANVFRHTQTTETRGDHDIPGVVITLVKASLLPTTRPDVWHSDCVNHWSKEARVHRLESRAGSARINY